MGSGGRRSCPGSSFPSLLPGSRIPGKAVHPHAQLRAACGRWGDGVTAGHGTGLGRWAISLEVGSCAREGRGGGGGASGPSSYQEERTCGSYVTRSGPWGGGASFLHGVRRVLLSLAGSCLWVGVGVGRRGCPGGCASSQRLEESPTPHEQHESAQGHLRSPWVLSALGSHRLQFPPAARRGCCRHSLL